MSGANDKEQLEAFINSECEKGKTAYLGFGNENVSDSCIKLPYGATAEEQAENLFSSLRTDDDMGCTAVYVRMPERTGIGLAVYNRLLRSAAFRIIKL